MTGDCKDFSVLVPSGVLRGWSSSLDSALWDLTIELLAKHQDYIVSGRDKSLAKDLRMSYLERAHELERIAACLAYITIQLNPNIWRVNKISLAEMFTRHDLETPAWLR